MTRRIRPRWLELFLLGFVMVAQPLGAQPLESRADAERRQECRSAAALLEAGAPLAAADARATLRAIRNCDVSGGPAIASAWANPALRTDELPLLMIISWEIQDRRIMDGVIGMALDEGAAQELRYGAMGVLASYLEPRYRPSPEQWYRSPDQEWPATISNFTHGQFWRPGTQPIDDASKLRILEVLQEVEATSSDIRVQRVAQAIRLWYEIGSRPRDD
jgi:hypothetical protein